MRLFTADEMRRVDRAAEEAGIASLLLMEAAGRKVAEHGIAHFSEVRRVLVLCGKGNNGGDGYAAARYLHALGREVQVLELATSPEALGSNDSRAMRAAWLAQGGWAAELTQERLAALLSRTELLVDALLGSGLSRPVEGRLAGVIDIINDSGLPVLSIDVPSGISADDVRPIGPHLRATRTLQLAGPKLASAFSPAAEAFGRWEVADIGIPERLLWAQSSRLLLGAQMVHPWLPTRPRDTHKYRVGTVLVIAGSARYAGAAEMSCRAALRAGAGLVTLAGEARFAGSWPEIIFEALAWDARPLDRLADIAAKRRQVCVIGPGLGERAGSYLPDFLKKNDAPTVLDAGALENSARWFEAVREHGRCVLTPHAGEASRLLGCPVEEITADPLGAARQLAEKSRAVTVLKGASTVIVAPDGRSAVNVCGHPGMATGGSGDVLSGLLGAWLAGAEDLFERAAATVFVHGLAGERAARRYGDGLIAGDLIEAFPRAWLELAHQ